MGITGLKQPLLEYLKKKQYSDSIDSLRNLVLGVDLSVWLNLAILGSDNIKDVARQFSCSPRQDSSQYIRKFLSKAFTFLKEYGIEIVLVADGCRNPLKSRTNTERSAIKEKAEGELQKYWKEGKYNEVTLNKLSKRVIRVTDDMLLAAQEWAIDNSIKIVCAPMEAEWQLVYMENVGIIDGIISRDTDILALGAKRVICDLNFASLNCTILNSVDVLAMIQNTFVNCKNASRQDAISLCVFLGCDYIQTGLAKFDKIKLQFHHWVNANACTREKLLDTVGTYGALLEGRKRKKEDQGYKQKFIFAFNQFLTPAVLKVEVEEDLNHRNIREAFFAGQYTVCLHDFMTAPPQNEDYINDAVGLPYVAKDEVLKHLGNSDQNTFKAIHDLRIWCRDGFPLEHHRMSRPLNHNGKEAPFGSIIDFDICPIDLLSTESLVIWLGFRGIFVRDATDKSRDKLCKYVKRFSNNLNVYPIIEDTVVGAGKYIALSVLTANRKANWRRQHEEILEAIRSFLPNIDETFIYNNFGVRNGVRDRAFLWLTGGHLNPGSLQYDECTLFDGSDAIMWSILCTPSQKASQYTIYLVFDKNTKRFLRAPVSRCTCTAGNLFCGHMLAALLLLHLIQKKCTLPTECDTEVYRRDLTTLQNLIDLMPISIQSIQTLPVPFLYVYGKDNESSSMTEDKHLSKLWKQGKKRKRNEKEENKYNKRRYLTKEEVEKAESEEEEELLCDENETSLKNKGHDILTYALNFINQASSRKEEGDDPAIINTKKIDDFNKVLTSERGPNSTTRRKYEQLRTHQLLHEAYEAGKLQKNMLSHYIKLSVKFRLEMMEAIANNSMIYFEENKYPLNLQNIPVGWIVLADRGFAFDAFKYPNLNRHITPAFINKRDQFTQEELESDLAICQLRYISETHFSRVTDESSLRDVVQHEYFPILQHIVDWANGAANLNQPFYDVNLI